MLSYNNRTNGLMSLKEAIQLNIGCLDIAANSRGTISSMQNRFITTWSYVRRL